MKCVISVFYSFVINGCSKGRLVSGRSFYEGDFIFLYLFFIVTEGFSSLFFYGVSIGEVYGIMVC